MRAFFAFAALGVLSGCATVIDGTSQTVTIRTAPVGAACTVRRGGQILATIPSTPGTLALRREREDLTVTCEKPGWATTTVTIPSKFTAVTAGNVLAGGLVGVVVDEATRANYRYDEDRVILLAPQLGLTAGPAAGPGRRMP